MTNERKLINKEITIFEALKNIENGKHVMPAFQRQYVWNLEQIIRYRYNDPQFLEGRQPPANCVRLNII